MDLAGRPDFSELDHGVGPDAGLRSDPDAFTDDRIGTDLDRPVDFSRVVNDGRGMDQDFFGLRRVGLLNRKVLHAFQPRKRGTFLSQGVKTQITRSRICVFPSEATGPSVPAKKVFRATLTCPRARM